MTNLLMKPQIAMILRSIITVITITLRSFMLLPHMIHRSPGHFSPKLTFITKLPFSNRILKIDPNINYNTMFKLIQAPAIIPSHPSLHL